MITYKKERKLILLEKYIIIGRKWIEQRFLNDRLQHHGVKDQKWGVRNGPPYPIKRIKNANGDAILLVNRTELYGPPNGITQRTGKKGGIERNYYDENGRQFKQINNNDHGQPKFHPFGNHGEHAHDYIYDEGGELISRKSRNLSLEERKENGDIL